MLSADSKHGRIYLDPVRFQTCSPQYKVPRIQTKKRASCLKGCLAGTTKSLVRFFVEPTAGKPEPTVPFTSFTSESPQPSAVKQP